MKLKYTFEYAIRKLHKDFKKNPLKRKNITFNNVIDNKNMHNHLKDLENAIKVGFRRFQFHINSPGGNKLATLKMINKINKLSEQHDLDIAVNMNKAQSAATHLAYSVARKSKKHALPTDKHLLTMNENGKFMTHSPRFISPNMEEIKPNNATLKNLEEVRNAAKQAFYKYSYLTDKNNINELIKQYPNEKSKILDSRKKVRKALYGGAKENLYKDNILNPNINTKTALHNFNLTKNNLHDLKGNSKNINETHRLKQFNYTTDAIANNDIKLNPTKMKQKRLIDEIKNKSWNSYLSKAEENLLNNYLKKFDIEKEKKIMHEFYTQLVAQSSINHKLKMSSFIKQFIHEKETGNDIHPIGKALKHLMNLYSTNK